MRELTDWFVACGVHAFFVLGSYGQGPAMTPEERKKVAEIIVQQVKHRVPVVVHVGAVDPYTAIDLGKHAKIDRRGSDRPRRALLLRRSFGVRDHRAFQNGRSRRRHADADLQ